MVGWKTIRATSPPAMRWERSNERRDPDTQGLKVPALLKLHIKQETRP
jgi:hypothetical protein